MFRLLSRSTSRLTERSPADASRVPEGVKGTQPMVEEEGSQQVSTAASSVGAHSTPSTSAHQLPADCNASTPQGPTARSQKRFSWRSLVHPKGVQDHKPSLPPPLEEASKEVAVRQEYIERRMVRTRSEKRAHASALVVRDLIVGPFALPTAAPPKSAKVSASAVSSLQKMQRVKAQLLEPKAAQKVITQLRQLPTSDVPIVIGKTSAGEPVKSLPKGPIHAVCLPYCDAEANEKRFSRLGKLERAPMRAHKAPPNASSKAEERSLDTSVVSRAAEGIASVTATSLETLREVLSDLDVMSLITAPDLGLGQPINSPGLFSGALPSTDAIVEGIEEMTPQLMALGYATGQSILPSHAGIYPPTDRMSVITYWWGLEVVMPEPSVKYLSNVPSIAHTVINFLTALSVANGGVREILPFVRYISQYIDSEWRMIQQADQGQGVICAATWLMPAALVPRAWDFPQPPVPSASSDDGAAPPANSSTPAQTSGSTAASTSSPTLLTPPLPDPNHAPVFVAPPGSLVAQSVPGNPEEGVPGVTVTPPTPPASETLGKAAGEGFKGAVVGGEAPVAIAAAA